MCEHGLIFKKDSYCLACRALSISALKKTLFNDLYESIAPSSFVEIGEFTINSEWTPKFMIPRQYLYTN